MSADISINKTDSAWLYEEILGVWHNKIYLKQGLLRRDFLTAQ